MMKEITKTQRSHKMKNRFLHLKPFMMKTNTQQISIISLGNMTKPWMIQPIGTKGSLVTSYCRINGFFQAIRPLTKIGIDRIHFVFQMHVLWIVVTILVLWFLVWTISKPIYRWFIRQVYHHGIIILLCSYQLSLLL